MTKQIRKKLLAEQRQSPTDLRSKMITDAVFIALAIIFSWNMTHLFTINFATFVLLSLITVGLWISANKSRLFRLGTFFVALFGSLYLYLFLFINYSAIFIVANDFKDTSEGSYLGDIAPYLSAVWIGIAFAVTEKIVFYYKESQVLPKEKFFDRMFLRIFTRTFGLLAVILASYLIYSFTGFLGNAVVITLLIAKLYFDFVMYKKATL